MRIDAREVLRQAVFLLVLLGILAGSWVFVFRPRDAEDAQMRQQIELKQKQLQKLNRATASIGNLRDEIAELEKAIAFFESKLPSEKEIDKVLEELWRLAEANNLSTKGIFTLKKVAAPGAFVSAAGPHAEQPIKMKFEGDCTGFYRFLLALESQPRIMRISQMALKQESAAKGLISVEMEMSIFFDRPDAGRNAQPWPSRT